MTYRLSDLAEYLKKAGMACEIEGDAGLEITGLNTLEEASSSEISFLSNAKYAALLATTKAAAVIVSREQTVPAGMTVLRTNDPYAAMMMLAVHIYGYRRHPGSGVNVAAVIDPSATVGEGANIHHGVTVCANVQIGRSAVLYPGAYVAAGCRLGDNCVLHANVVLYEGCILGNRVTVHAGSVIGQDGLGYAPIGDKWHKIPQVGVVEIGDDVEIGANCAIDRATLGRTVIASGTKLSNLIAIGHGTKIGRDCMLVAQVGIAGSVTVGNHVTMAGKVGVAGHLTIGDNAQLAAMAGVMRDVPPGAKQLGAPATDMTEAARSMSLVMKLPEMRRKIKQLESELADLRRAVDGRGQSRAD
jgi:UDP-3-O-[3-hydroxymyristoyl] glucosamine N-acyltransferase